MKTVNPYFLNDLMSPITGLADDDNAIKYYSNLNINTEEKFRSIIKDLFLPYYENLDHTKKQKSKLALSYYLSKADYDFERVFESCLPPFDPPSNARNFFLWLWEELFNGEDYLIKDLKSYKVVLDIHEPNIP